MSEPTSPNRSRAGLVQHLREQWRNRRQRPKFIRLMMLSVLLAAMVAALALRQHLPDPDKTEPKTESVKLAEVLAHDAGTKPQVKMDYKGLTIVVTRGGKEVSTEMRPFSPLVGELEALQEKGEVDFTYPVVTLGNTVTDEYMNLRTLIDVIWLAVLGVMVYTSIGGSLSGGRSMYRPVTAKENTVRFADVAGIDSARHEIEEAVRFLKNPSILEAMGARAPSGILLVGPPGVGKTLLAKAIAGEAGVPFFEASGAGFDEMFVGVGMMRLKRLFRAARKASPCIVFIDEFDALASKRRDVPYTGRHHNQTINHLLTEMDGFRGRDGVLVLAATNRIADLDEAILRPGRFDRQIHLSQPDRQARRDILIAHSRGRTFAADVDFDTLAGMTTGMSGADLANLLDEAAMHALRRQVDTVAWQDVLSACDRVRMGLPSGRKLSEEDRRRVAVHEAGHAIAAARLPYADRPERATIMPRGEALGMVVSAADDDRINLSQPQLESRMGVLLAGRAAEDLVLGNVSAGAGNDLAEATRLATAMVCKLGMSPDLGLMVRPAPGELGFDPATTGEAINELLHEADKRARLLLSYHRAELDAVSQALLDRETLTGPEIEAMMEEAAARAQAGVVLLPAPDLAEGDVAARRFCPS